MADRYTVKDAEGCFSLLMDVLKVPKRFRGDKGSCYTKGGKAKVGCIYLEHSFYGFNINKIANEAGGVSQPFGLENKSAKEFCKAAHFAVRAIEFKQKRRL